MNDNDILLLCYEMAMVPGRPRRQSVEQPRRGGAFRSQLKKKRLFFLGFLWHEKKGGREDIFFGFFESRAKGSIPLSVIAEIETGMRRG